MRKPNPNAKPRDNRIMIHLNDEEYKAVNEAAKKREMPVSQFIREAVLAAIEISEIVGE